MNYSELREFVVNELIEENYHKQRRESDEVNELILKRIELSEQVCGAAGMRRTVCGESNQAVSLGETRPNGSELRIVQNYSTQKQRMF